MRIIPSNRYVVVKKITESDSQEEEKKAGSNFYMPKDFFEERTEMAQYELREVVSASPHCNNKYRTGDIIAVETAMIEMIPAPNDKAFYVISENYIMAKYLE